MGLAWWFWLCVGFYIEWSHGQKKYGYVCYSNTHCWHSLQIRMDRMIDIVFFILLFLVSRSQAQVSHDLISCHHNWRLSWVMIAYRATRLSSGFGPSLTSAISTIRKINSSPFATANCKQWWASNDSAHLLCWNISKHISSVSLEMLQLTNENSD